MRSRDRPDDVVLKPVGNCMRLLEGDVRIPEDDMELDESALSRFPRLQEMMADDFLLCSDDCNDPLHMTRFYGPIHEHIVALFHDIDAPVHDVERYDDTDDRIDEIGSGDLDGDQGSDDSEIRIQITAVMEAIRLDHQAVGLPVDL